MTQLQRLEDKIREVLPHLKEVGVGLEFIDNLGFKAKIVFIDSSVHYFSNSDNEIFNVFVPYFNSKCLEIIGHPIMLNDVLEYLLYYRKYSGSDKQTVKLVNTWNLYSPYLSEQSDEMIEFLNDL